MESKRTNTGAESRRVVIREFAEVKDGETLVSEGTKLQFVG